MAEEVFPKVLSFLATVLARVEHQLCVQVDLIYCPSTGFRSETIRTWHRGNDPEQYFGVPADPNSPDDAQHSHVFTEKFAGEIIELAEGHAESFGQGRHRFQLRSTQHLRSREICAFVVLPSFTSSDSDSLTVSGAGSAVLEPTQQGVTAQLMRHLENNNKATREMMQTFLQGIGTMAAQLRDMRRSAS